MIRPRKRGFKVSLIKRVVDPHAFVAAESVVAVFPPAVALGSLLTYANRVNSNSNVVASHEAEVVGSRRPRLNSSAFSSATIEPAVTNW